MIFILVSIAMLLLVLFAWGLCAAASAADAQMEAQFQEMRQKREGGSLVLMDHFPLKEDAHAG